MSEKLQGVINEGKEAKRMLKEQKIIINNCKTEMLEVRGQRISRRDYAFGFVQKMLRFLLPVTYAAYLTIFITLLLSVSNAVSDLSIFFWLLNQQHTNQAYLVLGKQN